MVNKKARYKYNSVNKKGKEEPYSGVFNSKKQSDAWYNTYGKEHEKNGIVLKRVLVNEAEHKRYLRELQKADEEKEIRLKNNNWSLFL